MTAEWWKYLWPECWLIGWICPETSKPVIHDYAVFEFYLGGKEGKEYEWREPPSGFPANGTHDSDGNGKLEFNCIGLVDATLSGLNLRTTNNAGFGDGWCEVKLNEIGKGDIIKLSGGYGKRDHLGIASSVTKDIYGNLTIKLFGAHNSTTNIDWITLYVDSKGELFNVNEKGEKEPFYKIDENGQYILDRNGNKVRSLPRELTAYRPIEFTVKFICGPPDPPTPPTGICVNL